MNDKPNYFANIPANVRYCKEISNGSKLLYGELTALSNKKGYCWASNGYFAELYGNSNKTISRWVSELEQHGFITVIFVKQKDNTMQRYISIVKDVEIEDENVQPMDKNAAPYGQKCPTGMDKNGEYNITLNNTKNAEEEPQKNAVKKTAHKAAKDATTTPGNDRSVMTVKSEYLWQMDYTNNTELNAKLTNWAFSEILQQLPAICTKHGKQYTDEQLQAWTKQQLTTDKVNVLKTTFSMYGEPLHSDTVKHLLNRANWQLRERGGLDIAAVAVKPQTKRNVNYETPFK